MTPGICYVYEYNQSKRIRNVGFLKFSAKYQRITLQLHLRGITVHPGDSARLFVFYQQEDALPAKEVLSLLCGDKSVSGDIVIPDSDLIPGKSMDEISGFFLLTEGGQYYAAVSAENVFDTSSIKSWIPEPAAEPVVEPADAPTEEPTEEPEIEPEKASEQNVTRYPLEESEAATEETESELHATCRTAEDAQTATSAEEQKEAAAQPDDTPKIRKIQRADLAILPRRCWNIANNSFLMHGYHNYHHLLLVEENGHFWVGVPGLYSPREAKAAELFGFSQFTETYVDHLNLADDEKDSSKQFGHWCRFMR